MNNSSKLERKILLNRLGKKNLIPEEALNYIRAHILLLFPEESVRYALVDDDTNKIISLFTSEEGVKKAFDANTSNCARWEEF